MLKTSALVGLASVAVGCSNVNGYVLGQPVTSLARVEDRIRLVEENNSRIAPAKNVDTSYFRLETKPNKYAPASLEQERSKPYKLSQEYKGIIWFGKDF